MVDISSAPLTQFQFGGTREWLTWSASKRGSRAPSNEQTLNSLVQAIKCSAFWPYAVWWATLQYNHLAQLALAQELAWTLCYDRVLDYCIRIMIQCSERKNKRDAWSRLENYHSESTLLENVAVFKHKRRLLTYALVWIGTVESLLSLFMYVVRY